MENNTYTFTVDGREVKDFEFIMGPMYGVSIPPPPRKPSEFVKAGYEGGAMPLIAPRVCGKNAMDIFIKEIHQTSREMGQRRFGVNCMAMATLRDDFIEEMKTQVDEGYGPRFVDINGIEMDFENCLHRIEEVDYPVYLGFHQPISVYSLLKYLRKKEYSFLLDRMESGWLKFYIPRAIGGGHLPVVKHEQLAADWEDLLLEEVLNIEKELKVRVPFIIEKGMTTVDDFVSTIRKYSEFPSFCGVRFASVILLTKECPLNDGIKGVITEMIKTQDKDMLLPLRSVLAGVKRGKKIRGGVFTYYVATKLARMIFDQQRCGEEFPKFARPFLDDLLKYQKSKNQEPPLCQKCITNCSREYCEIHAAEGATDPDSDVDDSLITVSPRIFDIDPAYIGASVTDVVSDIIKKTLAHFD